jgi:hypothetical protein
MFVGIILMTRVIYYRTIDPHPRPDGSFEKPFTSFRAALYAAIYAIAGPVRIIELECENEPSLFLGR